MNITKKQKLVLDAIKRCPAAANDEALLLEQVWHWCTQYWNLFVRK